MKKNNFKSLAAVLSLAMAATAVPVNANAAAAPKITVSKKTVYSGKTYSATVKNLKKGYTVQFSSTQGGVNFKTKKVKATGAKVTAKFTVKAAKNIADGSTTKIKAVVKNASGKKVATVSQKVTLKQLAKSLTVKDMVTTTVKVGDTVNADATISPAAAKGAYKKVFTSSDSKVLEVKNASNGLFTAVAPGKATISVTATNDKGKVVEGSKTIEITVVAAEEQKPDDSNNQPAEPTTGSSIGTTTGSAITTEYKLELKAASSEITADSKSQTDIEVFLKAPTNATINEDMKVAVQLALGTKGIGSLSQEDITMSYSAEKQAWYGVVKFTSATLTAETTSKLTAAISSVINGPEGVNLIGVSAEPITIKLVPAKVEAVDEVVAAKATKVVVESCDRLTVTFNKVVKKENYMTDDGKAVANGVNSQSVVNKPEKPEYFKLWVQDAVNETTSTKIDDVKNNATFTEDDIADIVRVDDYTLTFVLKNEAGKYLKDNSKFLFDFVDQHAGVTSVESGVLYNYISDTKAPSVMAVEATDMKTLKVTFDQPLYSVESTKSTAATSDYAQTTALINALSLFNYTVDGQIMSREWTRKDANNNDVSSFGAAGSVNIKLEDNTKRDTVIITLGKDSSGKQAYFTAGNHVLQVSNVGDYAAATETGTNNRVTTKNFDFNVKGNDAAPSFTVTAQSPEQYKMTFTTPIAELDAYSVGQEVDYTKIGLDFQYKDTFVSGDLKTAMTDFKSALTSFGDGNGTGLGQEIKVTRVEDDSNGNPQLKVEVTKDWTELQDYTRNRKTYYNYTLAISCEKEKLTNAANGKINSDLIRRNLNNDIITTVDATTPVMQKINEIVAGSRYEVTFSEPVQASNEELVQSATGNYAHAYTPGNNTVGKMTAQIVNNKTKETYDAKITGWGNLEDTSVIVETSVGLKEGYEYTLYVRGVSDDVGNTSNTLSQTFTVGKKTVDTSFKVLSILADMDYGNSAFVTKSGIGYTTTATEKDSISATTAKWLDSNKTGTTAADAIYVEFSKDFQKSPIVDSVLNTQNWTINGAALPVGSTIISGLNDTKLPNDRNGVTIYLPHGTLTDVDATLIKVAPNVKDSSGNTIAGKTTFTTQSIFKGSIFNGTGDVFQTDGTTIRCINATATTLENN